MINIKKKHSICKKHDISYLKECHGCKLDIENYTKSSSYLKQKIVSNYDEKNIKLYNHTAWFQKATKSALPGWELKYANETILFRLQLFQCNVKIHLIRSIPEYKTNTKNSSLNIHIPAC